MFNIDKAMCRLIIFQRNEILTNFQKKVRKLFGRYLFTQFFSYFNNLNYVSSRYYEISQKEYDEIKSHIKNDNFSLLSIGGGLGGVESIILSQNKNIKVDIIEKNFVSSKIKYFWNPLEAYNKLNLTKKFLINNSRYNTNFQVFNFENKENFKKKYDVIISLFSMDYHYDLEIYKDFLNKNSHKDTIYIFDTIRAQELNNFFQKVKIINIIDKRIHSSSRVVCSGLKNI